MEIPFRNVPGFKSGGNSFIPFNMPFNYARLNIHDQDQIWKSGANLAVNTSGVITEFQDKIQKAEDYNNVAEARRMAKSSYDGYLQELHLRNDPENFNKGLEKIHADVQKQISEKFGSLASEKANMQINNEVADMYTEANLHATGVGNQKRVETLQADSMSRINAFLKVGDIPSAEKELANGEKLMIYGKAKAAQVRDSFAGIASENQVNNAIEAGNSAAVMADLNKKDSQGVYTMYPGLDPDRRAKLSNFAGKVLEQKQTEFKLAAVEAVKSQAYHGKLTPAQLEDAHAKKIINADTYKSLLNDVADPNRVIDFNAGTFDKMKQAEIAFLKSPQAQSDYNKYLTSFAELNTQLPKEYRSHFAKVLEGYGKPDNEKVTAKNSYKASAAIIKSAYDNNEFWIDPAGLGNKVKDTDGTQQAVGYATAMDELDEYMKANPGAPPDEAIKYAKGLVKAQQDNRLKTGFSHNYNQRKNVFGRSQPVLESGTVDGDYRFKGGNPSDKNNWEKVK